MNIQPEPPQLTRQTIDVINEATMRLLLLDMDFDSWSIDEIRKSIFRLHYILSEEHSRLFEILIHLESPLLTKQERNDYGPVYGK